VYARGKRWKELQLDVNLATVAYNFLNARDVDIFKSYEKSFRDAKTDADKAKIKADVANHLKEMRLNVTDYKDIVNSEFLAGLENIEKMFDEENLIKLFGNDTKLDAGRVVELIYDAMQRRLSNPRLGLMDDDLANYEAVMEEYKKWNKKAKKGIGWKGQTMFDVQNAINQRDKIYTDNQELFFRKALYEYTDEQLNAALAKIINSINQDKAITELELNAKGWGGEATTKPVGKATTKPKEEMQAVKGSIGYLKKLISETETLRDKTEFESDAWKKLTTSLNGYKATLAEMQKIQDVYDGKVEDSTVAVEGSIGYLQKLISEKEEERKALVVESDAWKDVTAELKTYNDELEKLLEIQDKYDGKTKDKAADPLSGSIADVQKKISELTTSRSMMVVESEAWIEATNTLKTYIAEYERLLAIQNKYDGVSDGEDKTIKKYNDMNVALSSSITLLNGLGDAFNACESENMKMVTGVTDMMSSIASGIMSFVQIQQAAAAASGTASAAAMPYPYNLAAIATVMATVLSVFANIKSMTSGKFAEGGIVGGTSYSGDKLFAMVNSGEMILNKRQQGNLANMIGGGGGQVEFHISGDSLVGVLNNKRNKTNLTR
jgi:hypothetical protein